VCVYVYSGVCRQIGTQTTGANEDVCQYWRVTVYAATVILPRCHLAVSPRCTRYIVLFLLYIGYNADPGLWKVAVVTAAATVVDVVVVVGVQLLA
jgi:hypothetical protein